LENVYINQVDRDVFNSILIGARNNIDFSPTNKSDFESNSKILQYAAFESLVAYILEQNGIDSTLSKNQYNIDIRSFNVVFTNFKNSLYQLANNQQLIFFSSDYVKDLRQFENIGRALDLYLALENAFKFFDFSEWNNLNSSILLNETQKQVVFDRFANRVSHLFEEKVHLDYYNLGVVEERQTEPGNRPLKGVVISALSSMACQKTFSGIWNNLTGYLDTAIYASKNHQNAQRYQHWAYQSSSGERQWAEGPYYLQFALKSVVPFWHSVRANGLLGSVDDPFKHNQGTTSASWFLNPTEWLADISTPEGYTPAIDDGNRHTMSIPKLLR